MAKSLLLSGTCGIVCYLTAGSTLDLFIGSFFFAAILTPPLTAMTGQLSGIVGISLGFAFCWWMPVHAEVITIHQWAMCVAILCTFVAASGMLTRALRFISPVVASAIVTTLSLAWLSWPVWLSGSIAGSHPNFSVLFHPLFAINHVVSALGIWTEQQGAYGLTNLGQDVGYQLPFSAWPVITLQMGIALVLKNVARH